MAVEGDTRHKCIECGEDCSCGNPDECQLCVDCYDPDDYDYGDDGLE